MQYPLPAFLPHIPIPMRMQHTLPIVRKPGMPPLKRRVTLTWAVRHINGDVVLSGGNQHHVTLRRIGIPGDIAEQFPQKIGDKHCV